MTTSPFSRSMPLTLPQVNVTILYRGSARLASSTCRFSSSSNTRSPLSRPAADQRVAAGPPCPGRRWSRCFDYITCTYKLALDFFCRSAHHELGREHDVVFRQRLPGLDHGHEQFRGAPAHVRLRMADAGQ